MSVPKVVDMSIQKIAAGWKLHVPIKTGHLEITVEAQNNDLNRFLETAYRSPARRFGEDPE